MGEIALAKAVGTKGFEKLVVLKRLRADAERDDHVAMFDVEQEVMSRIEHPNIVKVFDQPIVDGVPYMAMEYVRGRNLDQVVRSANHAGDALPYQYCLTVVSEVLRGLAFVHRLKDAEGRALGVVHQDMTPSNVMVSFFGEVKITDFGISYVTSRDGGLRRGVLKGKPRYVAPEVLAGKRVNNTADIYGVGVVLFEMLTGRALFARPSVKETLSAVARNELPNLAEELADFGPGIVAVMERALKKAPSERYRTAEEMAAHILNELAKLGGPMPPANLGFLTRKYFSNDPDVPEIDPALEQAIRHGSASTPELAPKDLESTLLELDKLLGKDDSVDLFSVPEDIMPELRELPDMDPFQAHTPLPEFVRDAKSDEEILARAGVHLTTNAVESMFDAPPRGGGLTKKDPPFPYAPQQLKLAPFDFAPAPTSPSSAWTPAELLPQVDDGPTIDQATEAPEPLDGRPSLLEPGPHSPAQPRPETPPCEAPEPSLDHEGPNAKPATSEFLEPDPHPTPAHVIQTDSWSGVWVGFAFGFATGLAAGAILYAALTH